MTTDRCSEHGLRSPAESRWWSIEELHRKNMSLEDLGLIMPSTYFIGPTFRAGKPPPLVLQDWVCRAGPRRCRRTGRTTRTSRSLAHLVMGTRQLIFVLVLRLNAFATLRELRLPFRIGRKRIQKRNFVGFIRRILQPNRVRCGGIHLICIDTYI
jgi:hypothetical protein